MATKKDLIEAQSFSRRRLLTAFTSGAPGGKELEPAQPLRAVVAAVALTAMVVLAGVFYGLLQPGLPKGWENDRLILVKDTGARYVSAQGELHPVINTASARLLIAAKNFKVISTDSTALHGIKVGSTVGILGAPDTLPPSASLIGDGWTACVAADGGTAVRIGSGRRVAETDGGAVVRRGEDLFVIAGGLRYAVAAGDRDPVLRAVGLDAAPVVEVDDAWLNLFTPGVAFEPMAVQDAGKTVGSTGLEVGEVVHPQGNPASDRFLVTTDGTLARLSPLAFALYQLGTGAVMGDGRDVSPSAVRGIPTATAAAGGADWPQRTLAPTETGTGLCAVLTHDGAVPHTVLATTTTTPQSGGVSVAGGGGALVAAEGSGSQGARLRYLIDASGTAYAIPGDASGRESTSRLGYSEKDVSRIGVDWIRFFDAGPALTQKAAGSSPRASGS